MKLPPVQVYVPVETVENAEVIELGGSHVEGIIFPSVMAPSGQRYDSFREEYKMKYGKDVPAYAAESYDAAMITMKAIAQSDGTKEDIQKQMYVVGNEYQGVSGVVTFDENGDIHAPMALKTIKDGKFVSIEVP